MKETVAILGGGHRAHAMAADLRYCRVEAMRLGIAKQDAMADVCRWQIEADQATSALDGAVHKLRR